MLLCFMFSQIDFDGINVAAQRHFEFLNAKRIINSSFISDRFNEKTGKSASHVSLHSFPTLVRAASI